MAEEPGEVGLRERKRLATRREIQRAVLTLCSAQSIDKVTVDAISRSADISPRTFFNYFSSKESALVGDGLELGCVEDIEAFVRGGASGDILGDLAVLLGKGLQPSEDDREIHELRRAVMKDNTYLFSMRMAFLRDLEVSLQEIIERRFVADDPSLGGDPQALRQRALLFTLVAVAATRHAWRCWADGDEAGSLSVYVAESFRELFTVASRSD